VKKSMSRRPVPAPHPSLGLDLGVESAEACLLTRTGEVEARFSLQLTPEDLAATLRDVEPLVIVLEASTVSSWVARELEKLGHDVVVCNPRRLKLIAGSTLKTDVLDAETLARLARLHQLDPKLVAPCTVRSRETQLHRSLLSVRDQLVEQRTANISHVRSILRSDAIRANVWDPRAFARKVGAMSLPDDLRAVIEPLLRMIQELNDNIANIEHRLDKIAASEAVVGRWREIPGIGLMTSLSLFLTIEDPERFEQSRDVGPYLGLVPTLRQSSSQERRGKCTKQGDSRTRRYLVQAALCLLRSKQDSDLKRWTLALAARVGRKKALVALARKLAIVMHRMWITGENFRPFAGKEAAAAA
jgi:transposase